MKDDRLIVVNNTCDLTPILIGFDLQIQMTTESTSFL